MAYILTETDITNAQTYIPIVEKSNLASDMAARCIVSVDITLDGEEDDLQKTPMPKAYTENNLGKALFLRGVLIGRYFGKEVNGKKPESISDYYMPANEYDMWGNLLNQIERFKGRNYPPEIRDKAYDIIADYKDFEKRLNTAAHQIVSLKNDFCTRFMAMTVMQTTPEFLKGQQEQLKELMGEIEKVKKNAKR